MVSGACVCMHACMLIQCAISLSPFWRRQRLVGYIKYVRCKSESFLLSVGVGLILIKEEYKFMGQLEQAA